MFCSPRLLVEEGRDGEGGTTLWTLIVRIVDRDVDVLEFISEGEREGTKRRAEGEASEEKKGREGVWDPLIFVDKDLPGVLITDDLVIVDSCGPSR